MKPRAPIATLPTHEVTNMPPHLGDQDLWASDPALREAVAREGAGWARDQLAGFGGTAGAEETFEKAEMANRYSPELKGFDRYGMRVNQVEYHPAYHDLMALAVENEVASFAWKHEGPGAQVGHAALTYMFNQVEGGVMCPMAMTYSAIPALRSTPVIAEDWIPRLLSNSYDRRDIPVGEKTGATIGMFMTEKQGGSDVRANSTHARPLGAATGIGAEYLLTGHKFFCSAPMCDAFLTLAGTDAGGISCFLVPRWRPDGERNTLLLQRIKRKLGNTSNASTEMELQDTWGVMVGEEGRGIRTIIDMVQGNRVYCAMASAALMRQGLVQALHYTRNRSAFQKRLAQQPLMRNVLADLAVESEAALVLGLRIARAMDEAPTNEDAAALARIGTAIAKYWNSKRAPSHVFEALECHGGSGYIEESIMPRLYREAPLNSIWEGSGNVICLDVLRAMQREPHAIPALLAELYTARGIDAGLDRAIKTLEEELANPADLEVRARSLTERIAVTLQATLLSLHAPEATARAFRSSRLSGDGTRAFGGLSPDTDFDVILERACPT
ncbi:MAG: acyl-CoA dehydrogenase family protein [Alphaproteobacteria bacterium]|nr:acyl-CoA dehydrogenase family protein [Alphaproteobacteria bacterium]